MTLLFVSIRKSPLFVKKALEQLLSVWSSFLHVIFSLSDQGSPQCVTWAGGMFFCSWCPYITASSCTLENYGEEGAGSSACAGLPMIVFTLIVSSLWGTWHNTKKNDETWYLWDAHHVPGGMGCMIQRPMSEVRESELLSPATYFF